MIPDVHTVTAAGVGVPYESLDGPLTVPASRTGIAHFRNPTDADVSVIVEIAGPFGPMDAELVIPAGATRFVALSDRLAADGRTITFRPYATPNGADVVFLVRDILDRA
jgi:hypothetical protein